MHLNITLIFGTFLLTMLVTIHISHVEFILGVTSCRCRMHALWRCLKTDIAARGLLKQDVIVFSRQFNIRDTGKHPGTERSSLADVMVHVWTDCLQSDSITSFGSWEQKRIQLSTSWSRDLFLIRDFRARVWHRKLLSRLWWRGVLVTEASDLWSFDGTGWGVGHAISSPRGWW